MSHSTLNLKSPNINLYDVAVNQRVRVKALSGEAAVCQRLREMGFCEFAEVRKVAQGSALICHVCGVNVALSKYLAKNIFVETIPAPAPPLAGQACRHPSGPFKKETQS